MKLLVRITVFALVTGVLTLPPAVETVTIPEVVDATVAVAMPRAPQAASTGAATDGATDRAALLRSAPTAAPIRFSMIGFELPAGIDRLAVRTADADGNWSAWEQLERIATEDGPDRDSAEGAADRSARFTDPLWVGDATRFQVEFDAGAAAGDLDVRATVIDAMGLSDGGGGRTLRVPGAVAEAATDATPTSSTSLAPPIVSRAEWGADESWRRNPPRVSDAVTMTVVHHTAHASSAAANAYSRAEAPALIRSFYRYHTQALGWNDIGYNLLVDRFGTIYEGRAGGVERGVVGAHASGYNSGSFGVSVIGNFVSEDASEAAYQSLADVIAWKSSLHGMDPLGSTDRTAEGRTLATVSGHRDMGQTSCPGRIADRLWWIREQASERMAEFPASLAAPPAVVPYPDVAEDSPHRASVLELADLDIIRGYADGRFGPADSLTRGQMATVIARAFGLEAVPPDGSFGDVTVATSHAGNIHAVHAAGIASGHTDGTFRPDEPLERDQMATFLSRALGLVPRAATFPDVSATSVHRGSIGALEAAEIATGDGNGHYGPDLRLRRDQAASLVARSLASRP